MGRKVYVTSDMSIDEKLAAVSEVDPQASLLWPWILTALDDWGRAEANALRLKARIFPMIDVVTPQTIESALLRFAKAGLLHLYRVDEKVYMAIPHDKWFKYQTHIRSEKRENDNSRIPAPNSENASGVLQVREGARDIADVSADRDQPHTFTFHPSPSLTPSSSSSQDTLGDLSGSVGVKDPSQDKHMLPLQHPEQVSIQDYCQEIEYAMVACGANPNYVVKKEALDWVKKFHASSVPIDFVKTGIQKCYDDNPEIHTFTYCAKRIEEWWAKELAFQTGAEPIDFQIRLAASRASPNVSRYVSQELPPEVQEWDKFAKRGTS